MRSHYIAKIIFLIAIILILTSNALAQSDSEKFAEGRVALEQHKDCSAALVGAPLARRFHRGWRVKNRDTTRKPPIDLSRTCS